MFRLPAPPLQIARRPAGRKAAPEGLLLMGANVDLESVNQGEPAYCVEPGQAVDLAGVPSDYSGCGWTGYVEGAGGLSDTGYIVRDTSGAHHYRMQIVSNTLPALKFHYAAID